MTTTVYNGTLASESKPIESQSRQANNATEAATAKKSNTNLADIARRAAARKADPSLRHAPNESDLRVASENVS